ncbi:MAG: DUF1761 domain-containing protein [Cyclobacteriaceae bacterium]|jgi:hypothetical protein
MEEITISWMAVLIAVVVNFILGFLWYTPLFGNAWAKEMGFDRTVKPTSGEMAKGMITMIIGNFFFAYVFANNMAAWSFVPGMNEMPSVGTIMNAAIFTWLGFYLPVDIGTVTWEKKSWKLFWINTGYHLAMLLVTATILTFL